MARSEAQKEADKRYRQKIEGSYKPLVINFKVDELVEVENAIKATGLTKTDFIRWAIEQAKLQNLKK